jgi:hypothetical protein
MKHVFILVMALLVVSAMSFAQQSTDVEFDADVAATAGPLTVVLSGNPTWNVLHPGTSYTCIADLPVNVTNITPIDPANQEAFTPGIIDITGGAGKQVAVTFVLPSTLVPAAGVGAIHMTYDNQSGSLVDLNSGLPFHFFNPQSGQTVTLDAAGNGEIWLGGNPSVDNNVLDGDTFVGYGLVTVEYL